MKVHCKTVLAAAALLAVTASPAAAQFGIGGRMAMIKQDVEAVDLDAVRFWGGQIRARTSPRIGIELSMDVHHEDDLLARRVRDIPIQASLLLYPFNGSFSPYLLGGGGWYFHRVESLVGGEVTESETTHEFGWHAGFGAELRLGRHAGVHGDYRYTFLRFGDSGDGHDNNILGRSFLPGYDGSMWTAGVTVYF